MLQGKVNKKEIFSYLVLIISPNAPALYAHNLSNL